MAGKSKQAKKKRAKMRKHEQELLNQKPKKIVADQPEEVLGNNAEPVPAEINEDAGKDITDQIVDIENKLAIPEKPFDPSSVVANILKKKE